MIKRLKIKSENKLLIANTSYLFIFQLLNYLFPLLILPYVIPILTTEKYGTVIFIQTFANYFLMITEYGFNISSTKFIAQNKENFEKIEKHFNLILFSKLFLAFVGLICFIVLLFIFPKTFDEEMYIYLLAFLIVFGMAISPTWLFQGFENMKIIVITNFLVKLLFVASVFLFIKSEKDYVLFIALNSFSYILLGLLLLFLAQKTYHFKFLRIKLNHIIEELKNSFHYFASKISGALYLNNNILLLGIFGTPESVGYYAVAEKVVRSLLALMNPLTQASLPHVSKYFSISRKAGIQQVYKLMKILIPALLLLTLIIFLTSDLITQILLGKEQYNHEIVNLIKIMSPIPLFGLIGYFMAYHFLANLDLIKYVPRAMIIAAVVNFLLNISLIPLIGAYGAAISILITEFGLLLLFVLIYKVKGKALVV